MRQTEPEFTQEEREEITKAICRLRALKMSVPPPPPARRRLSKAMLAEVKPRYHHPRWPKTLEDVQ